MFRHDFFTCWQRSCLIILAVAAYGHAADRAKIEYNRDIRPILADKCLRCHGPDAAARQAELRLDQRDAATADRGDYRVIAPGQPQSSALIHRITSTDGDQRMPPPDSGSTLTASEIELLEQWIRAGASYQRHWSFVAPMRPPLPRDVNDRWSRNAIDRFVGARLAAAGLAPAAAADWTTLIRRVTLDLTGLPPTLEELDAFETAARNDPEAAYRRLVDRLLASPRYGERMAVGWLDAARYADTNGYFTDNERTMWPWRDWVIRAFNANMPFDQFTVEQLAGDLLEDTEPGSERVATAGAAPATIASSRHIATGFNRNHMVNNETGIIEEEFRIEYVVDRVDTTATVWMGLTLGCARCHDHKYDPLTQQDFYRFFAFFNNVPERGLSGSSGNSAPLLSVPSIEQQLRLAQLRRDVAEAERDVATHQEQLAAAQSVWEQTAADLAPQPTSTGLVSHVNLDDLPQAAHDTGSITLIDGLLGRAAKFDGDGGIELQQRVDFERTDAFSFGAWIEARGAGCVVSQTDDAREMRGFDLTLRKGKAIVNLVDQWNRNAIQVASRASISNGTWHHLMVTYDGSSRATGVRLYLDGQLQVVDIQLDRLTGSIRNDQPLRIGRRQASAAFKGLIDDVRIYHRQLAADEVKELATGQLVRGIVARSPADRSSGQTGMLRAWFLEHHAPDALAKSSLWLDDLRRQERQLLKNLPTTMVMQEAEQPRPTFLLHRGQYDQEGEAVTAGLPQLFAKKPPPGQSSPSPATRLDLATWLVAPSHPLTARVTANRLWQQLFGMGIVKTADDFGTQGDWPSHPQLLDWMALELIESGWDLKHLLRLMATSATYRQSSRCDPELLERDRENRLLARGPRFRLDAEMLRDNALAISGLLIEELGGPSVKPYQPDGLWEDVTYDSDSAYQQHNGAALYRRSLYTYWKRQSPPPNMLVFDATTRETCTVQRSRTNTPLQALVLMNDPTFVEASRKLAERMLLAATSAQDRLILGFRAATARRPTTAELRILLTVLEEQLAAFTENSASARQLLRVGSSQANASLPATELAAWTTVVSIILSLDETITRP